MTRLAPVLALVMTLAGPAAAQQATQATGAVLRGLDKVSGQASDIAVPSGRTARFGRLEITVFECRHPKGNPAGDAFAGIEIIEQGKRAPIFRGWMIASAPALSALDHARYDVWVIRCTTASDG